MLKKLLFWSQNIGGLKHGAGIFSNKVTSKVPSCLLIYWPKSQLLDKLGKHKSREENQSPNENILHDGRIASHILKGRRELTIQGWNKPYIVIN